MATRRGFLAWGMGSETPCHAICDFNGRLLRQPRNCAERAPGSTVKPLLAGLLAPEERHLCLRQVEAGGRRLDCVHAPVNGPLDVETALAVSCNSWFAQASRRLDGLTVQRAVQAWGGKATAATTADELCLVVLGLERIWFTPGALARAYARLRREGAAAVVRGLEASVRYGTASAGGAGEFEAGKTGTVREGGWFAGWAEREVIAVFVAGGRGGADAVPAARRILAQWHEVSAG